MKNSLLYVSTFIGGLFIGHALVSDLMYHLIGGAL